MFPRKKGHKKDPQPVSPLTPPSMEGDDLDPAYVIFHQPLPIAARRSDHTWGAVPSPIRLGVDWLSKKGLTEEGLYRVPGKATTFATYKALFDRGVDFDFFELHEMAPENVAMVLIKYLQALPEPIYSSKYEAHFKLALAIQNDQERATVLKGIMYMIPLAYRETIKVLVDHLRLVASNSEINKMTFRNVELTWGLSVGQMTGALMKVLGESPFPVPSTLQFYLPLEVAVENTPRSMTNEVHKVPYAVTTLIKYLNEHDGPSHPNLFSTEPKNADLIEDIVYVLNGGASSSELVKEPNVLPPEMNVVDAAVCLKLWISALPGEAGLFPEAVRPDFVRTCPPPAEGKAMNFGTLPDKLEALVWKLPDVHLETIKAITAFLREWTTFAPEDMTSIKAIELVFPSYPTPLQHVLAYLLHHHDALFATDDADLTAHLQSLVFGGANNAAGAPLLAGLSSPLLSSPRGHHHHIGTVGKAQSHPLSPTVNRINYEAGSSATTAATTSAAPGGENSDASSSSTTAAAAAVASSSVASEDSQSTDSTASTFSTPEHGSKKRKDKSSDSPSTPGTKAKKSKTLKVGSTTSSPAKIKKIKEAEDTASPSKAERSKTPKSEKVKDKTPKSSPKTTVVASAASTDAGSASTESTPKSKKSKLAKSPSSSSETPVPSTPAAETSPSTTVERTKPTPIPEETTLVATTAQNASRANLSRSASSDVASGESSSSKEETSSTSTATTSTAMTASTATVAAAVVPAASSSPPSSVSAAAAAAAPKTTTPTQAEGTPTGSPSGSRVASGRPGSGRAQRRGEKELAALLTSIVAANEEEMAAKQKAKEEKRASKEAEAEAAAAAAEERRQAEEQGSTEDGDDDEDGLAAMVVAGSPPPKRKSKRKSDTTSTPTPTPAPVGDGGVDSTSSSSSKKKKKRVQENVEDETESGSQREGESSEQRSAESAGLATTSNGKKEKLRVVEASPSEEASAEDGGSGSGTATTSDKPSKKSKSSETNGSTPERSEKRRSKKLEEGLVTDAAVLSSGDSSPGESPSGSPSGSKSRKDKSAASVVPTNLESGSTASKKNRIKVSAAE